MKIEIELQDDFVKILKWLIVLKLGSTSRLEKSTPERREKFLKEEIEELIVELAEEEVFNRVCEIKEVGETLNKYYNEAFWTVEEKDR